MQKIKKIILVPMIISLLAGCGIMKGYNVYERVYNTYSKMESYKASVAVTSYSNNSENKYTLTQYYKCPNKQRSEYSPGNGGGSITIINGKEGKLFSDYGTDPVILDAIDIDEKDYLMLETFFEIYYSSEETSIKTSGSDNNGTLTLRAETGNSHPYRKRIELVIDSKSLKPKKMTVFGYDNKPALCIQYLSFELNPTLEDSIFK
ncbi:MAG: hypothetical protein Q8873_03305 [Bacillota bacterium]|nr:hypothetical protein [Bacillota bacterium]